MKTTPQRGSLLIVAMLFAAIIALSLASFLKLANQSSNLSYRSFYAGASMNAAETGLEQAMWAINKRRAGDTTIWANNGWTVTPAGTARRTITLAPLSGGATAQVKVLVSSANLVGASPFVIARSIITPPRGAPIERWVQISLSRRSRFSTGLVAKDNIRFNGNNASVDSYDSRLGAYTPNSFANRFDRGTAGSTSILADTFNLGNADIWGSAIVGTPDTSGLNVGSNGTIGPFGTASGTVVEANVQTNFTANFEDVAQPAAYSGTGAYNITTIDTATTLPRPARSITTGNGKNAVTTNYPADTPAADGKYYYNINSISLGGNASNILAVNDNVVIRMIPTTGSAISIGGSASIAINNAYTKTTVTLLPPSSTTVTITPKLEIFTQADVDISGNGVASSAKPENFKLWGTRPQSNPSPQSLTINGNGVLSAVVYAPNANISMHGGGNSGNVYGSMIGKTITVTGNSAFHYDEALAELDGGGAFGLSKWNEFVTYADRQTYASLMNF
jgi:hypothetical protein